MLKALIVYFSQLGTTAKVAESIAGGLKAGGYEVDIHSLKDAPLPNPKGYDLLGIGSPVYTYTQPGNILDHAKTLSDLEGIPAFIFNTYGTYRFDAAGVLTKQLSKKGLIVAGYFACHGSGGYLGYVKRGFLFSPDSPTAKDLARAEAFGREMADLVKAENYIPLYQEKPAPIIYRLERFLSNRWLIRHVYSRFFSVNWKTCNSCGICIKTCPVKNIRSNKSGQPLWLGNCIGCFVCEMKCPQDAIHSVLDWAVFRPFLNYNVKAAARDKSLQYSRVKHSRGKTLRL